jgi:hypothetical protein
MPLIIWDILADEVIVGAKQTGYGHYAMLHNQIIKAQGVRWWSDHWRIWVYEED